MDWMVLKEMLNVYVLLFLAIVGIFCVFIGYMVASIRITMYLKRYYPEVDFTQTPKKRLQMIDESEKKEKKKREDIEKEEQNTKNEKE
jgi:TM2 domain-containing membrane protein YozV